MRQRTDPTNGTRRFRRSDSPDAPGSTASTLLRTSRRSWQGSASTKESRTAEAVEDLAAILRFEKQAGRLWRRVRRVTICFGHCATPAVPRRQLRRRQPALCRPQDCSAEADPVCRCHPSAEKENALSSRTEVPVSSEMVMNIQKGLSNLGLCRCRRRWRCRRSDARAIRHFEKHYRLPQTGEPNPKVLKKLKEIGAL